MPYIIRGISKTGLCSWVERGAGNVHFGPRESAAVFLDKRQAWFRVAQILESVARPSANSRSTRETITRGAVSEAARCLRAPMKILPRESGSWAREFSASTDNRLRLRSPPMRVEPQTSRSLQGDGTPKS
jgi:hypothetical protein